MERRNRLAYLLVKIKISKDGLGNSIEQLPFDGACQLRGLGKIMGDGDLPNEQQDGTV